MRTLRTMTTSLLITAGLLTIAPTVVKHTAYAADGVISPTPPTDPATRTFPGCPTCAN